MVYRLIIIISIAFLLAAASACSGPETKAPENQAPSANAPAAASPQVSRSTPDAKSALPQRTPAKGITAADIAKIKWLEGSWRGKGADKPFFNRYKFTGTTLDVASFDDEAMTKKIDTAHYELQNGMFQTPEGAEGDRFAASEITANYIQFVTLTGTSAAFKMENVGDGTVKATIEWTGADGNPNRTSYILEPLKK